MKRIIFAIVVFIPLTVFGQLVNDVSKAGTTAAAFLEIGIGSRAVGLGEAYVAIANDASAVYWNPAGPAKLGDNQLGLNHIEWFADVTIDDASLAFPIQGFGTLAFSLTMLNMGDQDVRTVAQPEGTGERFGANDIAAAISYARNLTDRFAIGGTVKFIRQSIFNMHANGVALDVGTMFQTPLDGLRLGMSITNFGTDMQMRGDDAVVFVDVAPDNFGSNNRIVSRLDLESWSLPLNFRAGVAYEIKQTRGSKLTLALEGLHPNNNTESVNVGGEYLFQGFVAVRAGYRSLFVRDGEGGLSLGAGLTTKIAGMHLQVDYSYSDHNRLQTAQRFSLGLMF